MKPAARKKTRIALLLAGLYVVAAAIFGVGIYTFQWQSGAVAAASRVIPYPAIMVGWDMVPLRTYLSDFASLKRYWAHQRENQNVLLGIPDEAHMRESLVEKLIAEKIISAWADTHSISVSSQEVDAEWAQISQSETNSETIAEFIDKAYGWSPEQFKSRVLLPFLLQQKVIGALQAEYGLREDDLRKQSQAVYELVSREHADFAAIAEEISDDAATAHLGGDLGYFGRGTMEPGLEQVIFEMEIGEINMPVQSSYGWHIIKLEDMLYDDAGTAVSARARHILVAGFDFDEWLQTQKSERAIYRLVR
ncbi:MAG: peptidylprolyl isomerase [bacterium]|nr:peptidylprolyl isomerase [bacterium]